MSEVTFAKGFLATVDKKPVKLAADYAGDPKTYAAQAPYILSKQAHAFPTRAAGKDDAKAKKHVSVTIKPMRGGQTVTGDFSLDATVHDVKSLYATKTGAERVKVLYKKKPANELKTLRDLGVDGDVEFGVMVMGGAEQYSSAAPESEKAHEEATGKKTALDDQFWTDLRGYLEQRLRDANEAERLVTVFRGAC
ncbi:hypothetical protein K470DRAFT_266281 [Piedraia hortae CBS 480.64]|uniref:Ubiquitin-like domain-containing protein n=1 Tax=Piedraia hortae CBS 480.64 TaxID=1314780 RepID=A0A6A7BTC8_9PEZI|nr:hypothetical protein K470DRAFT_266281 [Piedraia hortae CBS 480.64]